MRTRRKVAEATAPRRENVPRHILFRFAGMPRNVSDDAGTGRISEKKR